jgi:hypothetical protein
VDYSSVPCPRIHDSGISVPLELSYLALMCEGIGITGVSQKYRYEFTALASVPVPATRYPELTIIAWTE